VTTSRYLRPVAVWGRRWIGGKKGDPAPAAQHIGGKAARTEWLRQLGLPVVESWVLDARAMRAFMRARLDRELRPRALLGAADDDVRMARAARARAKILASALPDGLLVALASLWASVASRAPFGLAVRSSATSEDDELVSMAGLAHSELGVFGSEALARAVQTVWASVFLPRALSYLAAQGVRDVSMAVLLQPLVAADVAGVAFTTPAGEMVVNASFGLGQPVVDGASTPDIARVELATGRVIEYVVAEKRTSCVATAAGVATLEVPSDRHRAPALLAGQLAELASHARTIAQHTNGAPFDIEFAFVGPKLWILQARPVTLRGRPAGGDAQTVWSRANVGEALPGAATPLTWSVAAAFSDLGFRKAFAALGCSVPGGILLVASVRGRFYLNLTAFTRIAAQLPGVDPRALLLFGGGELLEQGVAPSPARAGLARAPWVATRIVLDQAGLARRIERFGPRVERARRTMTEMDLSILPDDGVAMALRAAQKLLDECGALMLSCAGAALASYVGLSMLVDRIAPESSARIVRALASGVGDLESARPGIALAAVAATIARDAPARAAVERGSVRGPGDLPRGPGRRALEGFLSTYGDRAVREVELMTPRWSEDPTPVVAMVRAALGRPASDPEQAQERAYEAHERELAALAARSRPPWAWLARMLSARARRFTRERERTRAWVTRVLGMIRLVALEADRRLLRTYPDLGKDAVFFCTMDEIVRALTSGLADIVPIVRVRRAEHARDASCPDPPVTFVGAPASVVFPPESGSVLSGLAASGGVACGTARVLSGGVRDAGLFVAGEVLVLRSADVAMTPLFLVACAVVTEQGGPLSHASIIAREYGVPAVVNVRGAMTAIRTGDRLRVDGDQGTVERLGAAGDPV
jgi:rifampicin phosphotransferase